ncbi:MAG: NAD(P)-dependent oxidoreductase [Firmicutes bacterium]|nr:NAD(P)-dependent oxidoreductase [Bacillota bacterium]
MKKVLVTGAAGMIGLKTLKYLLSEGKYEITALDLKMKSSIQKLKKYRNRINIVLGDVTDRILVEALVKDHDIIIHLAGTLPPFADLKKDLANLIDYNGTENIVRAISYYNPKCFLIYASTTSLYNGEYEVTVKTPIKINEFSYYNQAKYKAENLMKEKLKYYTIFRLPYVLGDLKKDSFPLNGEKNKLIEVITKEDAAYAFVKAIDKKDLLNKKTYNVTGDETIKYRDLLDKYLEIYGLSWKYIINRMFWDKNFYNSTCADREVLNDILNYRTRSLKEYFDKIKRRTKKRDFFVFLAKPLRRGKN